MEWVRSTTSIPVSLSETLTHSLAAFSELPWPIAKYQFLTKWRECNPASEYHDLFNEELRPKISRQIKRADFDQLLKYAAVMHFYKRCQEKRATEQTRLLRIVKIYYGAEKPDILACFPTEWKNPALLWAIIKVQYKIHGTQIMTLPVNFIFTAVGDKRSQRVLHKKIHDMTLSQRREEMGVRPRANRIEERGAER